MNLLCPECCSEEAALVDRGSRLECGNCAAAFSREQALVTVADAEAHAERAAADAEALDRLAAKLNEPGDWNGADICELVADLLRCTGRPIEDEPDNEGIWS